MASVIYVNGRYARAGDATISAEDRGFQFADAVYEVCEVRARALIDLTRHFERLDRSLTALGIAAPMSRAALGHVMRETIRRNAVRDGIVYLQVSRGAGPRNFALPPAGTRPTLVCLARRLSRSKLEASAEAGIKVKTMPDIRWGRCDIKTVMLLPAVLAKAAAGKEGASEAWLIDAAGMVTEGAASNAWIVDAQGHLRTRPVGDGNILAGVTRLRAMEVAVALGFELQERAFSVAEALAAREAFITSASNIVLAVVRIDGTVVGDGRPGPVARALRARFHEFAEASG